MIFYFLLFDLLFFSLGNSYEIFTLLFLPFEDLNFLGLNVTSSSSSSSSKSSSSSSSSSLSAKTELSKSSDIFLLPALLASLESKIY